MQHHEIITINSRNRIGGTDSRFSYEFRPRNPDFDRVVVLEAHIPKTYYLVQEPYNTFTLTEGPASAVVRVPVGNYTRRSFQTAIARVLTEASPNEYKYTVEYPDTLVSADTGKYTYRVSSGGLLIPLEDQPAFIFAGDMFEQLGFPMNSVNRFVDNVLTSMHVIKLQVEDTLFLYSDLVGGDSNTCILQEIFAADSPNFSSIDYHCSDVQKCSRKIASTGADTYNFWLLDEDGHYIDLNGGNMVITIELFKSLPLLDYLKSPAIIDLLRSAWQKIALERAN